METIKLNGRELYELGLDYCSRCLNDEARHYLLQSLKINPDLKLAQVLLEDIPENSNILNLDGEG